MPTDHGSENANFLLIKRLSLCIPTELINLSLKPELILLQSLSIEHGVVPENIHAPPPPPLPTKGTFVWDPYPPGPSCLKLSSDNAGLVRDLNSDLKA